MRKDVKQLNEIIYLKYYYFYIWKSDTHGKIWSEPIIYDCWRETISPKQYIDKYQKNIPANMPLIETDSSFGGLGIYKISKLKNCKYNGFVYHKDKVLYSQCEHVALNTDIRNNGGKIFICPSLLVTCPIEHLINKSHI